jgi:tetratricopeptide (TPR) repeat protein
VSGTGSINVQQKFAQALECLRTGRLQDAELRYRQVLAVDPLHVGALNGLGVLACQAGRYDAAAELIGRVVRLRPDLAEAHSNLATALNGLGRFSEALDACRNAIRLKPDYIDAHYNLGTILTNLQRFDEALPAYQAAIALKLDHAGAHANLGATLQKLERPQEAVTALNTAIRLQPAFAGAHYNLGIALTDLGCFDEALAALNTAIRLQSDFAGAHYQESVVHLLRGDLARGWPKFEWRSEGPDPLQPPLRFGKPKWQGEDISGRSILLHAEQGLGDTIQFARYAAMLAARGAQVIFGVDRRMLRLLSGIPGVAHLVAFGDIPPAFDCHCPLLSLPGVFGTTLQTIPAHTPYLRAEAGLVDKWRSRIGPDGFKIGIAWQGRPNVPIDRGRSMPLAHFLHLAKIPGVRLISLQKAAGLEQLQALPAGMRVETLGEDFDNGPDAFIDTAAAMMSLDLVVTSDTSICHLAGALNRPVWVPLKAVPHWVFMMDRRDSPWYPSMRLLRQTERGDWGGVFRRMGVELAAHMEKTGCRNGL